MDEFDCEIFRCYCVTVVNEMVGVTVRAAYSTCFSEGMDFSCALFDASGRMFAQGAGLPVHLGTLFDAVQVLLQTYTSMAPGDVFIQNDPLSGGSHQSDIAVACPMFARGQLVGIAVNRGHWIDIGGMAAGGWSGGANHIMQEGLRMPWIRLFAGGEVNDEVRRVLLTNIRQPRESWGDLEAQVAACRAAETRIAESVERYGLDGFWTGVEYILSYSARRLKTAIAALPEGQYEGSEGLEDDGQGNGPFHLHARISVQDLHITVDLSDASPQGAGPINCSWHLSKGGVYAALKAVLDPEMPLDSALLSFVTVVGRPGTWVYPQYPAPMSGGTAEPSFRVCEAVVQALAEAVPGRVPATSYLSGLNVTGSGIDPRTGSEFVWYHYGPGGCGAMVDGDGNSGTWHLMSPCRIESMEVWERRFPVRFTKLELRSNSGGQGEFRGGLGYRREMTLLVDHSMNALQDRHLEGAPGRNGGGAGVPNALLFCIGGRWGDARYHFGLSSPSKLNNVRVPANSTVAICAGGGGGYGAARLRRPELRQRDRDYGYIRADKDRVHKR
jgi:N-methylhydantoinase B